MLISTNETHTRARFRSIARKPSTTKRMRNSIDLFVKSVSDTFVEDVFCFFFKKLSYLLLFRLTSAWKRIKKTKRIWRTTKNYWKTNNKVLRIQACFVVAPYRMTFRRTTIHTTNYIVLSVVVYTIWICCLYMW